MRVIIEDSGERKIVQIQEYVHYANTLQDLGDSQYDTISQDGITRAITDAKLKKIFVVDPSVPEPDPEPEPNTIDHYQNYLDYLESIIEDEANRYPDIALDPTYQEYLDYLGINLNPVDSPIPEFPVINEVINETALGYLLLSPVDLEIKPELPIGFNFVAISKTNNPIRINLPLGETIWAPEGLVNYLEIMDKVELIKISQTEWLRSDLLRLRFID